jgi:hypothetical protein
MIALPGAKQRREVRVTEFMTFFERIRTVSKELTGERWLAEERQRLARAGISAEIRTTAGGRIALYRLS